MNSHEMKAVTAATMASLVLVGCATAPVSPEGSAEVRAKLSRLQADPNLGSRAPLALREAETAARIAEEPLPKRDAQLGAHRVYMADKMVDIAVAKATTRYSEDQRAALAGQREASRLEARTREADQARDSAADAASAAALAAAELQRQISELQARPTDRGLVVTLGDVLFATGRADLKSGGTANLDKLVAFLNEYPDRNAQIEGHTDNVGSSSSNMALSERRAEAVRTHLIGKGIGSQRLVASGYGEEQPVADNASADGRQQNRRVEIIIANAPVAASAE